MRDSLHLRHIVRALSEVSANGCLILRTHWRMLFKLSCITSQLDHFGFHLLCLTLKISFFFLGQRRYSFMDTALSGSKRGCSLVVWEHYLLLVLKCRLGKHFFLLGKLLGENRLLIQRLSKKPLFDWTQTLLLLLETCREAGISLICHVAS
jgi:hypothetical protein